jgi:hypothetical protein
MKVKLTGTVMEIKEEFDDKNNKLATVTAMIYQQGEKTLIAVKKVPNEIVEAGLIVEDLYVRASAYNFNGNHGMAVAYVG